MQRGLLMQMVEHGEHSLLTMASPELRNSLQQKWEECSKKLAASLNTYVSQGRRADHSKQTHVKESQISNDKDIALKNQSHFFSPLPRLWQRESLFWKEQKYKGMKLEGCFTSTRAVQRNDCKHTVVFSPN